LATRRDTLLTSLEALPASSRAAAELGDYTDQMSGEGEGDLLEGIDLVRRCWRDAARVAFRSCGDPARPTRPRIERLGRALGPSVLQSSSPWPIAARRPAPQHQQDAARGDPVGRRRGRTGPTFA